MGFEANHKNRDVSLPKQRAKLLNAIEEDVINDKNVLAVYYGGSIANHSTDVYSDIDLRIVVRDEVFEEYVSNKKQRSNNWGKVLFFEDLPWATYTIAHYESFIKVDTFYYKVKDIQPSVWLQNIRVVHDPLGFMKDILHASMGLTYFPTADEVDIWRTKFFAYVHETYRRVMRNEIYYALRCIDNLRLSMITGWYMEENIQPNTFGDWARLEGNQTKLNDWQLSQLENWFCIREANEIMNVVKKMLPEFKRVHHSLCKKTEIDENPEWVNEIINMVV